MPKTIEVICCTECKYAHLTSDGECKYCDKIDGEQYFPKGFYCAMGEMDEQKLKERKEFNEYYTGLVLGFGESRIGE